MASEIRANSITSRAGLSTVTLTDSGPMFSGITTFVDNSGFNIGTGSSIFSPATNTLTFGTNSNERLRIHSDGDISIGTSPSDNNTNVHLKVANAGGDVGLRIQNNSNTDSGTTASLYFTTSATDSFNTARIQARRSDGALTFSYGTTENLRIDSSGRLGIGDDSPTVAVSIKNTAPKIKFIDSDATGTPETLVDGSGGDLILDVDKDDEKGSTLFMVKIDGSEKVRITSGGNVDINGTPPWTVTGGDWRNLSISGQTASSSGFIWLGNGAAATNADFDLGRINFCNGATITSQIAGSTQTSANDDGRITFSTKATGGSLTERLRITSDGKVGLGRNDPAFALDIKSSGYSTLRLNNSSETGHGSHDVRIVGGGSNYQNIYFEGSTFKFNTYNGSSVGERLRITSAGKVSIGGNSSPDGDLHVYNSSAGSVTADTAANLLVLESSASQGMSILVPNNERANIRFGTTGTGGQIEAGIQYAHEAVSTTADRRAMIFRSGGGERMRIQNQALRVGDATHQNAGGRLQVVEERGGQQYNDCNVYFETNANDWNLKTYYNSAGSHYHIVFVEQGSTRGSIYGNDGSNVNYNQGSDYRWKENIVEMTGTEGIDICKKLKPRKYNWIENREATGQVNTVDGFIAHEVQEAGVLGAVSGEKDAVNEDGSIKGQELDYGQMTPVLAAAIKGLITKVETLEQDNITLRARVTNLEGN